ncbi:siderophore-interacting protein [Bordetella genomosp. 12]|uniref:Siderophore-interacting protein n=1 Tax=Bordetella genomosp. 12 TaxID=463035 RepID=A0A261VL13_9BORD|nr:siderophore-interacting protein [Bordetella genomosp. 12]OZI74828.1 siderophore-interacting protein [Bordetella genomosp. 12]
MTSCTATAIVELDALADHLEAILASIATHDMQVEQAEDHYRIRAAFGQARLTVRGAGLHIEIATPDRASLNRMKHGLAGPIGFIAAKARPRIRWMGEQTGLVALADLRVVHVVSTQALTPMMRRVVLAGEDLGHLARADQMHCRLIFAPEGEAEPAWPMLDDQGHIVWPAGKMATRVYTLRKVQGDRITIDFALHEHAGPATRWALSARPGARVGVVGPAAGGPRAADLHVMLGDETGLPGIARMLESLPSQARGHAFIEVRDAACEVALQAPAGVAVRWLHRGAAPAGTTLLLPQALRQVDWPQDLSGVFVWAGCEYQAFRQMHRYLKHELGLPRACQLLYSHWHRTLSEEQIIEIGGEAYLPE